MSNTVVEASIPEEELPMTHEQLSALEEDLLPSEEIVASVPCNAKQSDIRRFLVDGSGEGFKYVETAGKLEDDEPIDKTRMVRNKVSEARRAAE